MSRLDQIANDFARARAQLARSAGDAIAWRDDQRTQLDRSRLDPLVEGARTFSGDLRQAIDAVAEAQRVIGR